MAVPKRPTGSTHAAAKASVMTREEVIARLEAVEARSETRSVELGGKLDYLTDILVGDHGLFTQMNALKTEALGQIGALRGEFKAEITVQVGAVKAEMIALRADNRTTRWTIVITLITSIMAASALILSVQANLLSAFQAGQTAAPSARAPR